MSKLPYTLGLRGESAVLGVKRGDLRRPGLARSGGGKDVVALHRQERASEQNGEGWIDGVLVSASGRVCEGLRD